MLLCLSSCFSPEILVENWIRDAWLYEDMEESYGFGDTVSVKIKKKDGVGCWLILECGDFREAVYHSSETDEYFEFTFDMPKDSIKMDLMIVDAVDDR